MAYEGHRMLTPSEPSDPELSPQEKGVEQSAPSGSSSGAPPTAASPVAPASLGAGPTVAMTACEAAPAPRPDVGTTEVPPRPDVGTTDAPPRPDVGTTGSPPTSLVTPPPRRPASIPFLVVVTVVSLAADLASKGWAKAALSGFDPKAHGSRKLDVIKGHLDFIFAQNPGGAWSFLRGLPDGLRRPFFLAVSAAAIVFIVSIYRRIAHDQKAMRWGLPLALGGAMGNLVDRIRYGWVIDFVDIYVSGKPHDHHWPTFNVADCGVSVGLTMLILAMLVQREPQPVNATGK